MIAGLVLAAGVDLEAVVGDTIQLGGERLRLAAIDAPERGERAECLEKAARAELARDRPAAILAEGSDQPRIAHSFSTLGSLL